MDEDGIKKKIKKNPRLSFVVKVLTVYFFQLKNTLTQDVISSLQMGQLVNPEAQSEQQTM